MSSSSEKIFLSCISNNHKNCHVRMYLHSLVAKNGTAAVCSSSCVATIVMTWTYLSGGQPTQRGRCVCGACERVIWDMWGLEGLLTIYITFIHAVTHNNATHTPLAHPCAYFIISNTCAPLWSHTLSASASLSLVCICGCASNPQHIFSCTPVDNNGAGGGGGH